MPKYGTGGVRAGNIFGEWCMILLSPFGILSKSLRASLVGGGPSKVTDGDCSFRFELPPPLPPLSSSLSGCCLSDLLFRLRVVFFSSLDDPEL